MFWIIFILIWICSCAIYIALVYHDDKKYIYKVGNLIDRMDFYMLFPILNTFVLVLIGIGYISVFIADWLKLPELWEKFRNIKLK